MSIAPINYMAYYPQTNLGDSLLSGARAGAQILNSQLAQQEEQRKQQMLDAQKAKDQQFRTDFEQYWQNPTYESLAKMQALHPTMAKDLAESFNSLKQPEREALINSSLPIHAAITSKNFGKAREFLDKEIKATENANGDTTTLKNLRVLADKAETSPADANTLIGLSNILMNSMMGSKAFKEYNEGLKAYAGVAESESKTAENIAQTKNIEFNQNIENKKLENEKARLKLETDKNILTQQEQTQKNIKNTIEITNIAKNDYNAAVNARDLLNAGQEAIARLKNNPALKEVLGRYADSEWTKNTALRSPKELEAIADIKLLRNQNFLNGAQAMRGLGQLTQPEGEKAEAAIRNLQKEQNPERFLSELDSMEKSFNVLAPIVSEEFDLRRKTYDDARAKQYELVNQSNARSAPAGKGYRIRGVWYSDDVVNKLAKEKGMTPKEFLKKLGVQ